MTDQPSPATSVPVEREPQIRSSFLLEWVGLIATVFLISAFLCSIMRWLSENRGWDLGGTVLAGVLAWLAYSWTVSEKALNRPTQRWAAAVGLPVIWAVLLPVIMKALGFPG